jgi:hypothetical protein
MSGMRLANLLGCAAALALVGAACGESEDPNARRMAQVLPRAPLYSEAAAAKVAGSLLARVPLPAKTDRVAQLPTAAAGRLGRPRNSEFLAKGIDRHAYWISTEYPQALMTLLARKGPAPRLEYSDYGGVRGRTEEWSETLEVPTATPLAGPRELYVSIALAGHGRYAVRIDAVVAWHKRRPANSLVPATARWLEVTVVEPAFRGWRGVPARPRRTRSLTAGAAAPVQAVARAVNELPVAEPAGPNPSCPAMSLANTFSRPRVILTFRKLPSGGNLARVLTRSGYVCSRVGEASAKITTAGQRGLLLTDHLDGVTVAKGASLSDHLGAAFDGRLHLPS